MYGQNCGLNMLTHDHNLNLAQNKRENRVLYYYSFDQSGSKTHNKKGLNYREIKAFEKSNFYKNFPIPI